MRPYRLTVKNPATLLKIRERDGIQQTADRFVHNTQAFCLEYIIEICK